MEKIGIILCSKSKQDYACEAGEMYQTSTLFSAQQAFMDAVYNKWYINTSKYGFMEPTKWIEPYDSWYIKKTSKTSQLSNNPNILTNEMVDEWIDKVDKQFPNKDNIELHCHISFSYYEKLKLIFPNTRWFKPQVGSYANTTWKYVDAHKLLLNGVDLEKVFKFLVEPTPKKRQPEGKKRFYHYDGREYYGNAYEMSKIYKIDNGNIYSVSMGTTLISEGWVIDKELLSYIKTYPSGRFRLNKGHNKTTNKPSRQGLRDEINKLNERYIY
tara:strand:- start:45 stop:854 length:810 start_codon:yes stop_codon:yes gene_type:complete